MKNFNHLREILETYKEKESSRNSVYAEKGDWSIASGLYGLRFIICYKGKTVMECSFYSLGFFNSGFCLSYFPNADITEEECKEMAKIVMEWNPNLKLEKDVSEEVS